METAAVAAAADAGHCARSQSTATVEQDGRTGTDGNGRERTAATGGDGWEGAGKDGPTTGVGRLL